MKNKKQMILKFLTKEGLSSTGKIAQYISSNQYQTDDYLEELEGQDKVKRIVVPNAVYWELKFKQLPKNQTKEQIKKELNKGDTNDKIYTKQ